MTDTLADRRRLLIATTAAGAAATAGVAVPLVASLTPSERARAAGAPVEVDIGKLPPGEMMVVEWRGKPVWILHHTEAMLASLTTNEADLVDPESRHPMQPAYAQNRHRSIDPRYRVRRPISFAMFDAPRIADCFVAHPRHSYGYGCGSLRALGARMRVSACTQTYGAAY